MTYFGEKFLEHLRKVGITRYKIEQMTNFGLRQSRLASIVKGDYGPSDDVIEILAGLPQLQLSAEQLKAWRAIDDFGPEAIARAHQELNHAKGNSVMSSLAELPERAVKPDGFYRVACRGTVAAGELSWIDDNQDVAYYEWFDVPEYSSDLFCLKIRGDSMEPIFLDGGILLCRPAKTFRNGGYYVVLTEDGRSTFKVLKMGIGQAELIPLNKRHKPIDATDLDISRLFEVVEYKVNLLPGA